MTDPQRPACFTPPASTEAALAALRSRAHALLRLLRLARALADAGRPVDLGGLEQDVGRLCAGALDLADQHGAALHGEFVALLAEHDALAGSLRGASVSLRTG